MCTNMSIFTYNLNNITFTGMEKAPANFIDPTIIDDTTNTVVVSGT